MSEQAANRSGAGAATERELFDRRAGRGQSLTRQGDCGTITRAKTVHPVRADFSFQGSSHIIFKRPQVVTTGSVFANCPPSDTWGRNILNPGQRTGPPKKQKAQVRYQPGLFRQHR